MALVNCKECGMQVSTKANACPHCGAPISKEETTVPKYAAGCEMDRIDRKSGYSTKAEKRSSGCLKRIFIVFLMFVAFWVLLFILFGGEEDAKEQSKEPPKIEAQEEREVEFDKELFKNDCAEHLYKDIARMPDDYVGKNVKFDANVYQVIEGKNGNITMLAYQSGEELFSFDEWYIEYTREEGEPRILEDDNVVFYGICLGTKTYTTVLGAEKTILYLKAVTIDIIE